MGGCERERDVMKKTCGNKKWGRRGEEERESVA